MNEHSRNLPGDMTLDAAVPSKSNYLSKEDCDPPVLAEIAYMTQDEIEGDRGTETRAVLHFNGDLKPMILNNTNKELLKAITGARTVSEVRGKKIVCYNDPSIMFGKKMVGGIRIRAPKQQHVPEQTFDDDIPY